MRKYNAIAICVRSELCSLQSEMFNYGQTNLVKDLLSKSLTLNFGEWLFGK